ncbi:MAG: hypothetical protein AAGD35_19330 [Actinomycetota bacterium]
MSLLEVVVAIVVGLFALRWAVFLGGLVWERARRVWCRRFGHVYEATWVSLGVVDRDDLVEGQKADRLDVDACRRCGRIRQADDR